MEIEVKGHSGCSIDIVREGKELFILKGTCDPKYVERLYQQALKQQRAGEQEYSCAADCRYRETNRYYDDEDGVCIFT